MRRKYDITPEQVEEFKAKLPPRLYAALYLRVCQGAAIEDIMTTLRLPKSTVVSRINRAKFIIANKTDQHTGDESFQKKLGNRIRSLRRERGLTQCEVAAKAQFHLIGRLSLIESGQRQLKAIDLIRLSRVFNVSIDRMLDGLLDE